LDKLLSIKTQKEKMTEQEISKLRLKNQLITHSKFDSLSEIVAHLGAVQAQDFKMAKIALGSRYDCTHISHIDKSFDSKELIRTHILRPTWHIVAAEDIYWMLDISAVQVKKLMQTNNKHLELDEKTLQKCNSIIEKILSDNELSRNEIMFELNQHGINTDDLRSSHIMINAELDGIVCNGNIKGRDITYSLLSDRVTNKIMYAKEESCSILARKYFKSHGPATLQDFVWWSGLKISDCKKALESIRKDFACFNFNDQEYFFKELELENRNLANIQLLAAFDEFLVSYKSRFISITEDNTSIAFTKNGIFRPIVVQDAKVIGIWKYNAKSKQNKVEIEYFDKNTEIDPEILINSISQIENFLTNDIEG
jgi:DNA gyrase/topoisomerase IV subunit A